MSDIAGGGAGSGAHGNTGGEGPLLSVEGLVKHFKLDPKGLFDAPPILRAVDDPSDQVALVAALKSAAFCCSDVDLLRHRLAHGRFDIGKQGR